MCILHDRSVVFQAFLHGRGSSVYKPLLLLSLKEFKYSMFPTLKFDINTFKIDFFSSATAQIGPWSPH
jgi:hypothetical protein